MQTNPWHGIVRWHSIPDHEQGEIETYPPKPKRVRKRRMTLSRAMQQAKVAGIAVGGATLSVDGSVTLTFGASPDADKSEKINPWDKVLKRAPNKITLVKR